jgi:hypothetical protein
MSALGAIKRADVKIFKGRSVSVYLLRCSFTYDSCRAERRTDKGPWRGESPVMPFSARSATAAFATSGTVNGGRAPQGALQVTAPRRLQRHILHIPSKI